MTWPNRPIAHAIAFVWCIVNVWGSWPVHKNSTFVWAAALCIVLANPVLFCASAWIGTKRRWIVIAVAWPALVAASWILTPALGAVHRWGWDVFTTFLFRGVSWYTAPYWLLCAWAYVLGRLLARRTAPGSDQGHSSRSHSALC